MILVGCSGWSYDDRIGRFYPIELAKKKGDWFAYYAQYFKTAEINSTFYRPPGERQVQLWIRKAKDMQGFEYSVKVPQLVTHQALVEKDLEVLKERNVANVQVDGPGLPTGSVQTADHAYLRFHGRNYDIWYGAEKEDDHRLDRYDYLYRKDQLGVFFNNHARGVLAQRIIAVAVYNGKDRGLQTLVTFISLARASARSLNPSSSSMARISSLLALVMGFLGTAVQDPVSSVTS